MRSLDLSLHESSAFGKAFLSDFCRKYYSWWALAPLHLAIRGGGVGSGFLRCSAEGCYSQAISPLLATIFLLAVLSAQWAAVFSAITCVAYLDYSSYPLYISNGPIKRGLLSHFQLYARSSYLVNIQLLIIPQRRIPHTKYTSTNITHKKHPLIHERAINYNCECDTLQRVRIRSLWWALRDSNPRPSRCKRDALANWAKRPHAVMPHCLSGGRWRTWTTDLVIISDAL